MIFRGLGGLEERDARGRGLGKRGRTAPRTAPSKYGGRLPSKPLNSFLWSILRFNL